MENDEMVGCSGFSYKEWKHPATLITLGLPVPSIMPFGWKNIQQPD